MAIKIQGITIIDDGRNIVSAGIVTANTIDAGDVGISSSLRDYNSSSGDFGSILVSTGVGVSWTEPYAAGL